MVTTQPPLPLHAPPQLEKLQPLAAAGVKVTVVPALKLALHVEGQLTPVGELVTAPLPVTLTDNVKTCVNVADTDCAEFIVTVHPPVPLQAPPQPLKIQPFAGVAVKLTDVPLVKPALHVDGQLIPEGLLDTVPLPVTLAVNV
jgi:hypothetical protein